MNLIPKFDIRSLKYFSFQKHYGAVESFEDEFNTDRPLFDDIQPLGDVKCTCYSICDIGEDKEGIVFDIDDLFARIPNNNQGSDPKTAIKESINYGLLKIGDTTERKKPFSSYFTAHIGQYDAFDSVRSTISIAKYPIMAWSPWDSYWGLSTILPKLESYKSYHAFTIEGWTQKYGEPMLIIEAWVGRKLYMNRRTFNDLATYWGFGTAVLCDKIIDEKFQKTFMETIIDLMKNLIILLKAKKQPVGRIPSLYEVAYGLIGKHCTLNNSVDKSTGCAQAMSYILKKYGALIPNNGISGTYELNEWLKKNATEIKTPDVGSIIIYPTGSGNGKIRGHVFVCGYRNLMSNSSKTGLWSCDWTLEKAKKYYEEYGGLKPYYYRI